MRFWIWYQIEVAAWKIGTALREWACVSAGGEHDYTNEYPQDVCIVCGHHEGS